MKHMDTPPKKAEKTLTPATENGAEGLELRHDQGWISFTNKINPENLPKLEQKINSGSFKAEELFTEGIRGHWGDGFLSLGFGTRGSLSPEAMYSLLEKMPKEMLKSILTQISADGFKRLEKKIGSDKVAELVARFFIDLSGHEMRSLDENLSPLVAVKLAERTKTLEEDTSDLEEATEESSAVELGEQIDFGVDDKDVRDIEASISAKGKNTPSSDMAQESAVVLKPEDEIAPGGPDEDDTQEFDIPNYENETREYEVPSLDEKATPENLEIGEIMGDIEKEGYHVIPHKTEPRKTPEEIIADLKKLKEIIEKAKKEQARRLKENETIAIKNSNPLISKWVSIGGYDLYPTWRDSAKISNEKMHSDVESAIDSMEETHSMSKEEKKEDEKLGIISPQDIEVMEALSAYLKTKYPHLFENK